MFLQFVGFMAGWNNPQGLSREASRGDGRTCHDLRHTIVFGASVIFPRGFTGGVELFPLALTAASFVALYCLKVGVIWVVLACGVVGVLRQQLF